MKNNVEWNDCFGEDSVQNWNVFLSNVCCYKDSTVSKPFKGLAELVLNILCVPTSKAGIEHVFSIMNLTKIKIWNKMLCELLEALLRLKYNYRTNNSVCCEKFEPSPEMLKLMARRTSITKFLN